VLECFPESNSVVGQIVNLFAMCAGRTGGRMKVPPGVDDFSITYVALSRVRRIVNPIVNPPAAAVDNGRDASSCAQGNPSLGFLRDFLCVSASLR
jgi:hypothetical protein